MQPPPLPEVPLLVVFPLLELEPSQEQPPLWQEAP
jgi:hypothetical protein